jgi:hypothetical protein
LKKKFLKPERREGVGVGGGGPHEDDPAEVVRHRLLQLPVVVRAAGDVKLLLAVAPGGIGEVVRGWSSITQYFSHPDLKF